jgi:hypothetical protein
MGIFHDVTTIINLAPVTLTVTFDGQTRKIPLGESQIPTVAVNFAKNQNPVAGSADMDNPHISGARYLIAVKGSPTDRQEPLTREEWDEVQNKPSRWDTDAYFADHLSKKEHIEVRGKGKKVQAKSNFDAGVRVTSPETFTESN